MTDLDRAFDLVRLANPHETRVVPGKPNADEMLAAVRERPMAVPAAAPRQWRRGLVLAAAAFVIVLLVLIPSLLLTVDDEPPVTEPPTTTTSAAPTTTTLSPVPPDDVSGAIAGAWQNGSWGIWEFDDAGEFRVTSIGVIRDRGMYEVDGDVVTLTSSEASRDCSGAVGSYTVVLEDEGALVFAAVEPDGCEDRSSALDGAAVNRTEPAEGVDPFLDAETQALVDQFVAVYNAGDVEAFAAFLHPDFERPVTRERVAEPQDLETVLLLYAVDAALHMEVSLECEVSPSAVSCVPTKYDDLHRVQGIEPSEDRAWTFTFEDGLVRTWGEHRENTVSPYEADAMSPFLAWMRENHPEVDTLFPFVDGDWRVREGIVEDVGFYVAEWATSQGVALDG